MKNERECPPSANGGASNMGRDESLGCSCLFVNRSCVDAVVSLWIAQLEGRSWLMVNGLPDA